LPHIEFQLKSSTGATYVAFCFLYYCICSQLSGCFSGLIFHI